MFIGVAVVRVFSYWGFVPNLTKDLKRTSTSRWPGVTTVDDIYTSKITETRNGHSEGGRGRSQKELEVLLDKYEFRIRESDGNLFGSTADRPVLYIENLFNPFHVRSISFSLSVIVIQATPTDLTSLLPIHPLLERSPHPSWSILSRKIQYPSSNLSFFLSCDKIYFVLFLRLSLNWDFVWDLF